MFRKNKKANVIFEIFLWVIMCFIYFVIGYPLLKGIVDAIVIELNFTGFLLFLCNVLVFFPVFLLLYWGYTIKNNSEVA